MSFSRPLAGWGCLNFGFVSGTKGDAMLLLLGKDTNVRLLIHVSSTYSMKSSNSSPQALAWPMLVIFMHTLNCAASSEISNFSINVMDTPTPSPVPTPPATSPTLCSPTPLPLPSPTPTPSTRPVPLPSSQPTVLPTLLPSPMITPPSSAPPSPPPLSHMLKLSPSPSEGVLYFLPGAPCKSKRIYGCEQVHEALCGYRNMLHVPSQLLGLLCIPNMCFVFFVFSVFRQPE